MKRGVGGSLVGELVGVLDVRLGLLVLDVLRVDGVALHELLGALVQLPLQLLLATLHVEHLVATGGGGGALRGLPIDAHHGRGLLALPFLADLAGGEVDLALGLGLLAVETARVVERRRHHPGRRSRACRRSGQWEKCPVSVADGNKPGTASSHEIRVQLGN